MRKAQLTAKQQMFVKEYLCDLNATQAAIRAGYSTKRADAIGHENLRKPEIAAAIQTEMDKRAAAVDITAERVLKEIARMALYDAADIAGHKINGPEDIPTLPEDVRRAIIGWGWDKQGNFVLKLSPKTPSLELLGRHLKLFTDKHEHSGPGGGPIPTTSMTAEEYTKSLELLDREI
jgi:phage terminase small subunit